MPRFSKLSRLQDWEDGMKKLVLAVALVTALAPVALADTVSVLGSGPSFSLLSTPLADRWTVSGTITDVNNTMLDVDLVAFCPSADSCSSTALNVIVTWMGFTAPSSSFYTGDTALFTGTSTVAKGWAGALTLVDLTGMIPVTNPSPGLPYMNGGVVTGTLATAPTTPYDLIIEDTFTGAGLFSVDTLVSPTPEPAALGLFGSGLILLPMALRRVRKNK
jgi:PEP-CTERM motif